MIKKIIKEKKMSDVSSVLLKYPEYEVVIGIEVHVQLNTKSKIFCLSPNGPVDSPNHSVDPVCLGLPGTLPVINEEVINKAIKAALGTNSTINKVSEFARKHYFYPDLPKGYQITQSDKPICENGYVIITKPNQEEKKIRLIRIHIEEDAGKIIHGDNGKSYIDYNRAGSPLLEVVSYPDIRTTEEAKLYLKELHSIVTELNITTGDMEDGAFRADTNISVRKKGEKELGTRCELKNINSFKFIGDAIEYEVERQILLIESGEKIVQQTRLWDTKNKKTYRMRDKEDAADYRYFPDADLPLIIISDEKINLIKSHISEMPYEKRKRLMKKYNLSYDQAFILVDDKDAGVYFEKVYKITPSPLVINWILREIISYAKESKRNILTISFTASALASLIESIEQKVITAKIAQEVFQACLISGEFPLDYIEKHSLKIVEIGEADLQEIINTIIFHSPKQLEEYRKGKINLFGYFVGKIMSETKGQVDPVLINTFLKKILDQK